LGAVVLGFFGGSTQVGNGNAAGHVGGFLIGEVGDIPGNLSAGQGLGHGIVVHQQIPGKVQDDDPILHLGNGFGVDHLPGVVQQGRVQGNNVTLGINLIPAIYPDNVAVQVPGGLDGNKGVASIDVHSQSPGGVGQ